MSEEKLDKLTEKVNEILRLLNGNGKVGLCAKVAILWRGTIAIAMFIAAIAGAYIKSLM